MNHRIAVAGFFILCLGLLHPASAQANEAEAKCVQSALRAHGYDIAAVDGQIGPKTKAAFEAFRKSGKSPGFDLETYIRGWCLNLAYRTRTDEATLALAAPIARSSSVYLLMAIDRAVVEKLIVEGVGGMVLAESSSIGSETVYDKVVATATFPYLKIKDATNICVLFKKGWSVLDAQGAPFRESCDPYPIDFFTIKSLLMTYKVQKSG